MQNNTQKKINKIFNSVEIYTEYTSEVIKIENFNWNQDIHDFKIEYYVKQTKYVFHYNDQLARKIDPTNIADNPLGQLESEFKYIKRMYERGIGFLLCFELIGSRELPLAYCN